MVLLLDAVMKVDDGLNIGQNTISIAKESHSFLFMVLASFGFAPSTVGELQEESDVIVVFNAFRAR
jgi:hypothetical protein